MTRLYSTNNECPKSPNGSLWEIPSDKTDELHNNTFINNCSSMRGEEAKFHSEKIYGKMGVPEPIP
jgi:hypothetical protein